MFWAQAWRAKGQQPRHLIRLWHDHPRLACRSVSLLRQRRRLIRMSWTDCVESTMGFYWTGTSSHLVGSCSAPPITLMIGPRTFPENVCDLDFCEKAIPCIADMLAGSSLHSNLGKGVHRNSVSTINVRIGDVGYAEFQSWIFL